MRGVGGRYRLGVRFKRTIVCWVLAVGLGAVAAHAQFIRPNDASTSSQFNNSEFSIQNTINGSGLPLNFDQTSTHSNYTNGASNHWTTAGGSVAGITATFTFTTAQSLDAFYLWNHLSTTPYAGNNNYAVANFDLRFYDGSSNLVGSLLNQTAAKNVATAQTYTFGEIANVRSVVFTINSTHGVTDYTGLAEVGFRATAIPEPAQVAAGAAIAVLGLALWRRRRKGPREPGELGRNANLR